MPSNDEQLRDWESTFVAHREKYLAFESQARDLVDRMKQQSNRYKVAADRIFRERDTLMDTAYENLVKFVQELLNYQDGEQEIGTDGVPSLPEVVLSFKALATYCEKVIDDENIEAVESTQEIGENGQIIEGINALKTKIVSDLDGLGGAISRAQDQFRVEVEHHNLAMSALHDARGKQSGVMYDIFGDSGIDSSVRSCEQNEQNFRRSRDDAEYFCYKLQAISNEFMRYFREGIDNLLGFIGESTDDMRANYKLIGETRTVDNDCWVSTRLLQYHVTTNTEYSTRDDALRHIMKLLHTVNKTIDDDPHVTAFKENMESLVRDKLGADKAEELHHEKRFLATPEDVDF